MARSRAAGRSLRTDGLEAEQTHEPLSPLPIDAEVFSDLPRAEERPLDVQAVDLPHEDQVLGRLPEWLVVPAASRQADQLALPGYAQVLVVWVDALPLDLSRPRQLFFSTIRPPSSGGRSARRVPARQSPGRHAAAARQRTAPPLGP